MRAVIFLILGLNLALAHGVFYKVTKEEAIIIRANFSETVPASWAKVVIYEGDSAIPYLEGNADESGVFAFLPKSDGKFRVEVEAGSDHGSHKVEFSLDANLSSSSSPKEVEYDKLPFEKYSSIIATMGLILGIFGVIALIKTRGK